MSAKSFPNCKSLADPIRANICSAAEFSRSFEVLVQATFNNLGSAENEFLENQGYVALVKNPINKFSEQLQDLYKDEEGVEISCVGILKHKKNLNIHLEKKIEETCTKNDLMNYYKNDIIHWFDDSMQVESVKNTICVDKFLAGEVVADLCPGAGSFF